jgi:hypothetical protein
MTYDSSIAEEAVAAVTGDRAEAYGHPYDDFSKVAGMWKHLFGWDASASDVALAMICVKLARQKHSDARDNLVDIIGYSLACDAVLAEAPHRESSELNSLMIGKS